MGSWLKTQAEQDKEDQDDEPSVQSTVNESHYREHSIPIYNFLGNTKYFIVYNYSATPTEVKGEVTL